MKWAAPLIGILVVVTVVACGTDPDSDPGDEVASSGDTNDFGFKTSIITDPDGIYSIDDVTAAGWKLSEEIPADHVEGVSAVWFGYYQQRNLEVWIFASHDDAGRYGTRPAEDLVAEARVVAGVANKPRIQFSAYGVVGNLVILCEFEIAVCENLASALPQSR